MTLAPDMTIQERFERFHEKHPEVYDLLVSLARRWRQRGTDRWGIDAAFSVLRWEQRIAGLPDAAEEYKLNDHYRSRYARLIMQQEADLEDVFEIRALQRE